MIKTQCDDKGKWKSLLITAFWDCSVAQVALEGEGWPFKNAKTNVRSVVEDRVRNLC